MISSHVYRADREHSTDGYDCWCRPVFIVPCDECATSGEVSDGETVTLVMRDGQTIQVLHRPSCWKCRHGWVELSREEAEHADAAVIAVHHAEAHE